MDKYLVLSIILNLILVVLFFRNCDRVAPRHQIDLKDHQNITTLLRQIARWLAASFNDTNPYIANLHANYAQGYMMALTDIYPEGVIQKASGIDVFTLKKEVSKAQDAAVRKLALVCPGGRPKQEFLTKLAQY